MTGGQQRSKKDQVRELAEADLVAFIKLVHPKTVLGQIHEDVLRWWTRQDALSHQLLLLPRDHQKSRLVAYRVAWAVTRNPALRVLYISSTSNLATKQLKFIKDILTSDTYRYYWPDMVNTRDTDREKWTETEISVDHPERKAEMVRDPTIFTAGLTTSIVGLHCDISVFDDVVVPENAYTEDGRGKVETQFSLLASIEGAEAKQWVVGTRYHPLDLYQNMMNIVVDQYDDEGNITSTQPLYEKLERAVESLGDGTGDFIWPRQRRSDGQWFGFNKEILARKRAQYLDRTRFRSQYYNDPNSLEDSPIDPATFQYYEQSLIKMKDGGWHYKDRKLNVFAAVDFAYSTSSKADYTTIAVVGIDYDNNYYILDLDRFRTNKISEYFAHIVRLHEKWQFRKIRAEVSAAQSVIVQDLKDNYIKPYGLALSVEDYRPNRNQGNKAERINSILQSRYDNQQMWHYRGGTTQLLEEELTSRNPAHDDIKDAVASCVEMAVAPSIRRSSNRPDRVVYHTRFGGVL